MSNDKPETPMTVEMFQNVISRMGVLGLTHMQLKTMCAVARLMDKALCDMLEARATRVCTHCMDQADIKKIKITSVTINAKPIKYTNDKN